MLHQQIVSTQIGPSAETALAAVAGHSLQVDMGANRSNPKLWAVSAKSADAQYIRVRHPRNPTGIYAPASVLAGTDQPMFTRFRPACPLVNGETISVRAFQDNVGNQVVNGALIFNFNGVNAPSGEVKDVQSARITSGAMVAATLTRGITNIFNTGGFELIQGKRYCITRAAALSAATFMYGYLESPGFDGMQYPVPVVSTDVGIKGVPPLIELMGDLPEFVHPTPVHFGGFDQAGVTQPVVYVEVAQMD